MRVSVGRNTLSSCAVLVLLWLSGCCATTPRPPALAAADRIEVVRPERFERGCVFFLTGVAGACTTDRGLLRGLTEGNLDTAIVMYDWTDGRGSRVGNLQAHEEHRRQAAEVAARIVGYQDRYPGRPVHLVGYSGGAAMVVYALEALPPDRAVDSATLLGPVLAPDYNLSLAMARCRAPLRNFHSQLDAGALMLATIVLGTMEGRHCWSAGAVGFSTPAGLDPAQREAYQSRLAQQGYNPRFLTSGHIGGHYGWANQWFVAQWVAPVIADAGGKEMRR